jgi:hypothetical protein
MADSSLLVSPAISSSKAWKQGEHVSAFPALTFARFSKIVFCPL